MPIRLPSLTVYSPKPNAVVGTTPFSVTGLVTAPGFPEPVAINAVTVQVDSQPPVRAVLKHIANPKLVELTFSATVQLTGGQDPHTVTVTVNSDAGSVKQTITVTAGPRLAPPAILIDLSTLVDIPADDPRILSLLKGMAKQVVGMSLLGDLANIHKIVVGPNAVAVTGDRSILRIGFWILDADFPVAELQKTSADFPLPRLTDDAANGCFGLAPLLYPPPPSTVPPGDDAMCGFAVSVPQSTLQLIFEAMLPQIIDEAASNHFSISTATIQTNTTGSVTTSFSGTLPGGIPMSASLTETVGVKQLPNSDQKMPAVISSSHSTSVGDYTDWFIGVLVPKIGLIMLVELGLAKYGFGQAADQANGIFAGYLDSLPSLIPFRNSELPSKDQFPIPIDLQEKYHFPMAVLNFVSFTTDGNGLMGTGTVGIGARDQSMVTVQLHGPTYLPNYGNGIEYPFTVSLSHFEPDNDKMIWRVVGDARQHGFATDPFFQRGSFLGEFTLPPKPAPGKHHFTLSASATETCGTDQSRKLTGSASLAITADVGKTPPLAPEPVAEKIATQGD